MDSGRDHHDCYYEGEKTQRCEPPCVEAVANGFRGDNSGVLARGLGNA